jgi:hypothetical protein
MKYLFTLDDEFTNEAFPIGMQCIQDSGAKSSMRYISINQFMEAISPIRLHEKPQANEQYKNEVRVPFFPNGTVGYSSQMLDTGHLLERISVVVDKSVAGIQYRTPYIDKGLVFVGMPKLLFQFDLDTFLGTMDSRVLHQSFVYALKSNNDLVNEETELYIFPFTNVNKSDHSICWGSNANLSIPSLSHIQTLINLFISSHFNEDYGLMLDTKDITPTFSQYIDQNMEQPFNDELLVPAKRHLKDIYGHHVLNVNTTVTVPEENDSN